MKPLSRWLWLLALPISDAESADMARFRLERPQATPAVQSDNARFVVHAQATLLKPQAIPPRFTLKSALADCAPLPDPLFANGFE
jgi:hypothetical protein